MKKYGIIVIGYNRLNTIKRLLENLKRVEYYNDQFMLIISIDYSGEDLVKEFSDSFEWPYGEKKVITYKKNLGLRNHILKCGDYLESFNLDAVAVFEDDVLPGFGFYNFMRQTVEYYFDDEKVAGISLYSHKWNVNVNRSFTPLNNGSDVYYFQFAQSWGQVWIKNKWKDFKKWYNDNIEIDFSILPIPEFVKKWPASSWLKYHIAYCVVNEKYFIYPYLSKTTCFSEVGVHAKEQSSLYQVTLDMSINKQYSLCKFQDAMVYDSHFNINNDFLAKEISVLPSELTVDLYGTKNKIKTKYLITSKIMPFKVISSYGLLMRPMELNIIYHNLGSDIFLYDTSIDEKKIKLKYSKMNMILYDIRNDNIELTVLLKLLEKRICYFLSHMYNKIKKYFACWGN